MKFHEAVVSVFKNYVTFEGRAARSEFWYWALFNFLAGMVLGILDFVLFPPASHQGHHMNVLAGVFKIITFLPSLAVSVRRLHDVDHKGWWIFIAFTVIGMFYPLLYWDCKKGTDGPNRFGPDPLAGTITA